MVALPYPVNHRPPDRSPFPDPPGDRADDAAEAADARRLAFPAQPAEMQNMTPNANPFPLPSDLPAPVDDGAASHLPGMALPDVVLAATDGSDVSLARLAGRWVIYVYPMTGRPGVALPEGWDGIPGARGCTPQACAFRDHHAELQALGTGVFGLSVQATDYQREARDRLHLPFELLSDSGLELKAALRLPTFAVAGMELYRRLTLVVDDARIVKAFYPVFPPDRDAAEVLEWLRGRASPAPGRAPAQTQ
jgi:peroxiredoxin